MRVCGLLAALGGLAACGGNAHGNPRQAAGGSAGHDAGRESGSGGAAGGIFLDAGPLDSSYTDRASDCAIAVTLSIENEDGGNRCSVPSPDFAERDRDLIMITFARQDGATGALYHVHSSEACDSDATIFTPGWYYYETALAARIGFCANACASISTDGDGTVTVIRGCVQPGP